MLAFPHNSAGLLRLIDGYRLYSDAEGKSPRTIETVVGSVKVLEQLLANAGLSTAVDSIGHYAVANAAAERLTGLSIAEIKN